MAAIHAAGGSRREAAGATRPVLVVESTRDGGRKILISGGGRCNILPGEMDESRFVTDSSPNSLHKMLRSWPLAEQRAFFEDELGIPLRLERESGKLFPASNRARDVRDALVGAARARGVDFLFSTRIVALEAGGAEEGGVWQLESSDGARIDGAAVILASGGLSVPNTGSDGAGLLLAKQLGHEVHPTYAALTPLTDEDARFRALAGISLDVEMEAPTLRRPFRTRGGFLFTHRGYSGPAVLDLSHLAVRSIEPGPRRALPAQSRQRGPKVEAAARQKIFVRWAPLERPDWEERLAPRRAAVANVLRAELPSRLADALLWSAGVPEDRLLTELRSEERRRLLDALTRFELPWTGSEGYRTAEVTGGGVALSEVDPRTLESRRAPGLFFCGEILDAFGPIGGYNFAWAWATGRAAGLGAGRR